MSAYRSDEHIQAFQTNSSQADFSEFGNVEPILNSVGTISAYSIIFQNQDLQRRKQFVRDKRYTIWQSGSVFVDGKSQRLESWCARYHILAPLESRILASFQVSDIACKIQGECGQLHVII